MNGAQLLVQALRANGVDTIFGLPGDTGMAFYDALYHEPTINHIMTRDERHASFMADVYARITRRLGVCEGPSGGGATYIIPGVAEAQGSAIPRPLHDLRYSRERGLPQRPDRTRIRSNYSDRSRSGASGSIVQAGWKMLCIAPCGLRRAIVRAPCISPCPPMCWSRRAMVRFDHVRAGR